MPALATLTVVWLGAQRPDPAATLALDRFARERSARLEEPRREPVMDGSDSVPLAARCEAWLEQARDQLQADDDDAATAVLAQVEQTLRQHPELVQASWLMAERYRIQARIARRSTPERALEFERLAEITEGPRAAGFGDPPGAPASSANKLRVTLVVHGARHPEIYWDGVPSPRELSTNAGEHHLVVFRGARMAWAGWVSTLAAGSIDVWVPDAAPCTVDDFEGVALDQAARVIVPSGVRCGSWAVANPGPAPFAVSIAICKGDKCEPRTTLSDPLGAAASSDERVGAKGGLPAWATWTLAGVGVAAATSIVLWRSGVFDPAREPRMYYDGGGL